MKFNWKLPVVLVVLAGGVTGVSLNKNARAHVLEVFRHLSQSTAHAAEPEPDKSWTTNPPKTQWDRTLKLSDAEIKAIGLEKVRVLDQTDPTILNLFGTTDYVPAKVTIVRTQFDNCRVEKVLVDLGSTVKKGDPLLELFSTDLAAAKSDYEVACSQWAHDKKVFDYKAPLAKENTLAKKELIEVENDEFQSRLKMKLARDKLLVYGLTEEEIKDAPNEDGVQKARMILRSRGDGLVVKKTVVVGNYYDSSDELMTITPLDQLWVRGNVSELDADKVQVGQSLKVLFPFSLAEREVMAKIDYIDKAIDPETRSAKFRTSIPNPTGNVKAGAFVKVQVQIPPKEGRTVIPRASMVSVDRTDYVFIRKPGKDNVFERRSILTAKESNDIVIVAAPDSGHLELKASEEIVTTGSLILEQMYEDKVMAEGGLLVSKPGQDRLDRFRHQDVVISTTK
ncbi:MAG: efflux RND transporter periplasmic adaptor subunit [Isosphaeraceae bacterium]